MIVALKEIRLEHEEGAPCTAIREGMLLRHGILNEKRQWYVTAPVMEFVP